MLPATVIRHLLQVRHLSLSSVRQAIAFKGAPSVGKKRFRLPDCQDAEYLCRFVAGSNYRKEGQDVEIKPDSEYPDWLWSMRIGEPDIRQMDPESKEYWLELERLGQIRLKRLSNSTPVQVMYVGKNERTRIEYQERIKFRVLAGEETEDSLGFRPEDYIAPYDKKLFLRPQDSLAEEELLPDQFAQEQPMKFHKPTRAWDHETVKVRSKLRNRGMMMPF